jgi:NADH pyrophosphatase NudC (nudix superfamily)
MEREITIAGYRDSILRMKDMIDQIGASLTEQLKRFRFCAECGTQFIKNKRQIYCSSQCSNLVRTRTFRGKLATSVTP